LVEGLVVASFLSAKCIIAGLAREVTVMSFSVNRPADKSVVELVFEGAVNREQFLESRQRLRPIIAEKNVHGVLVDMRKIDWEMSTMDIHEFARTIQHPASVRIAILHTAEDRDARFFETVAKNRGKLVSAFTDPAEAYKFLGDKG
jgi:hypothetical protein